MKKVMQTKLVKGRGDCLPACVASLLHLKLEDVPDFVALNRSRWPDLLLRWLSDYGYGNLVLSRQQASNVGLKESGALCIAVGKTTRSEEYHAVLWRRGKCLHDPHPYGAGLRGKPAYFIVLLRQTPTAVRKKGVNE